MILVALVMILAGLAGLGYLAICVAWDRPEFPEDVHFYYINLKHRSDRRDHVLEELRQLAIPPDRIHRVEATQMTEGWRGCRLSHMKALREVQHRTEPWACILEDDFQVVSIRRDLYKVIKMAPHQAQVVCLSSNIQDQSWSPWIGLRRLTCGLCCSAYLIRPSYAKVLLAHWTNHPDDPIDMSWQALQKTDGFYVIQPKMAKQRPSYSDIEQRYTDYSALGT